VSKGKIINGYEDNAVVKELGDDKKKIWNESFECRDEIQTILRKKPSLVNQGLNGFDIDIAFSAYLLSKVCDYDKPCDVSFNTVIASVFEEAKNISIYNRIDKSWNALKSLVKKYDKNIFCIVASLFNYSDAGANAYTPVSVENLAIELLELDKKDTFADFGCGDGKVAIHVSSIVSGIKSTGFEIDYNSYALSKLHAEVTRSDVSFENKDIFQLALEKGKKEKFTKIFSNYPFGIKMRGLSVGVKYLETITKKIPAMTKATSADWLFNMLMVDMLDKNGKAVGVMTNGSTWNMIDEPIRKYFVENGYIETVISLPNKIFPTTGVGTSLIVLSHENKGVRLVDASELFVQGRRINEINDEQLDIILDSVKKDGKYSKYISLDELRNNDYVLSLTRYVGLSDKIQNGTRLETVIKKITRGAHLKAEELDKLSSAVPTDIQYLMLSNIKDGLIDSELPYLKSIDKKDEKYCLSNRCIILSKNGYPYKIAVAELKKKDKILANGNLYIIEVDETKVDPYYIVAFFNSEQGLASLKNITVGSMIPNIGIEQIKNMIIPIPDLTEQRVIAEKYKILKDEMELLQVKLERTKNKIANIFEKGGE